jgi:hypothetical protein
MGNCSSCGKNNKFVKNRNHMSKVIAIRNGIKRPFGNVAWNTGIPESEGWVRVDEMGQPAAKVNSSLSDKIIPPEAKEVIAKNTEIKESIEKRLTDLEEQFEKFNKTLNEILEKFTPIDEGDEKDLAIIGDEIVDLKRRVSELEAIVDHSNKTEVTEEGVSSPDEKSGVMNINDETAQDIINKLPEITDIEVLEGMLSSEAARGSRMRKTVVEALENRINALKN